MVVISKEEEVQKISTAIFVTNFPNHAKANDLWNVCKQYGQVVDAFIPDRKSKTGKRYGFVRSIRVYDVDRLVSNLCTLWMGSHHLHANVAKFMRPPAVKSGGYTHQNGATSWFSQIIQASKEFVIDERITSVDIEGIPLNLWSESTFNRIAAKWGKMLYLEKLDEGCLYSKRLCILTTEKSNILETFKVIHKGKRFSKNVEEKMDKSNGTVSIPFPLGFTPFDETKVECDKKSMGNNEGNGFGNEKRESVSIGSRKSNKIDIQRTRVRY
nr:UvrD-like helicase, ATP-binding domain, P-loop containing nucleoside triphosphate hydrolase [Tanacetum cinerariifolium]